MMKKVVFLMISVVLLVACKSIKPKEEIKVEIIKAEKEFQAMAAEKGVAEAFSYYADENGVIKRDNDSLIKGKAAIRNYYSNPLYKRVTVTWAPDYVEVSEGGDMAYTYGLYKWVMVDEQGGRKEYSGVFHTVWKRQVDGSWRYVWD